MDLRNIYILEVAERDSILIVEPLRNPIDGSDFWGICLPRVNNEDAFIARCKTLNEAMEDISISLMPITNRVKVIIKCEPGNLKGTDQTITMHPNPKEEEA